MRPFHACPHGFVGLKNASISRLVFPNIAAGFPRQSTGVLQVIAAGIGISNFLQAFFIIRLNSSSSGSIKKIQRHLLALSRRGYSSANFCFSLRFDASNISFQFSRHRESFLDVVCFLVNLSPDRVSHQSSNNLQYVSPTSHLKLCRLVTLMFSVE